MASAATPAPARARARPRAGPDTSLSSAEEPKREKRGRSSRYARAASEAPAWSERCGASIEWSRQPPRASRRTTRAAATDRARVPSEARDRCPPRGRRAPWRIVCPATQQPPDERRQPYVVWLLRAPTRAACAPQRDASRRLPSRSASGCVEKSLPTRPPSRPGERARGPPRPRDHARMCMDRARLSLPVAQRMRSPGRTTRDKRRSTNRKATTPLNQEHLSLLDCSARTTIPGVGCELRGDFPAPLRR